MEINKSNSKRIKVKGRCPKCGSDLTIGSWMYMGEPLTEAFFPECKNENCNEHWGYGSEIAYRFINHRTIKITGLWE